MIHVPITVAVNKQARLNDQQLRRLLHLDNLIKHGALNITIIV